MNNRIGKNHSMVGLRVWRIPLAAFLAVLGIYSCLSFILVFRFINEPLKAEAFGQFGDAFGAINSLFSALAFASVAASLYLQSKEFTTSIGQLIEANDNQRFSNLLTAIETFNHISQCACFDPFKLLHNKSERALTLQLFSSKLLIASLLAERESALGDFPSVTELRVARENAIRLFAEADTIMNESDELTFDASPARLEQMDETFEQIATNTIDCIADQKSRVMIELSFQRLRLERRLVREGLQPSHTSDVLVTNVEELERSLSKKHMLLACDVLMIAVKSLGLPCEYSKDVRDWTSS